MDNYYMRRFRCTRNQYRRIVNNQKYQEYLDGSEEEYEERKQLIQKSLVWRE